MRGNPNGWKSAYVQLCPGVGRWTWVAKRRKDSRLGEGGGGQGNTGSLPYFGLDIA
jgi:hypothetical protein